MFKEINKIYTASDKLNNWINKSSTSSNYETIFITLFFVLFVSLMIRDAFNYIIWLLFGILGLLFYSLLFIYGSTIRRSRILNHTIKRLEIKNNIVKIETFQSKIPFFKKSSINLLGNLDEVKIVAKEYPITDKKNISSNTKSIFLNGKELFLLADYFENDLQHYLYETLRPGL